MFLCGTRDASRIGYMRWGTSGLDGESRRFSSDSDSVPVPVSVSVAVPVSVPDSVSVSVSVPLFRSSPGAGQDIVYTFFRTSLQLRSLGLRSSL